MSKQKRSSYISFRLKQRKITVLLDKVLFFRYLQRLHGRFWGIAALIGVGIGFSICFAIRPELLDWSTAFSEFGDDIRTAPYFAGALFFAAYGLWRWRNYLSRTVKHSRLVTNLLSITILSLYLIALMPQGWHPWPFRVHYAAVITLGVSTALTVVADGLLSKTKPGTNFTYWRALRFVAFWLIVFGGWITLGSQSSLGWFELAGLGELMIIIGYGMWLIVKTYHGDGGRTTMSKMLHGFITIK